MKSITLFFGKMTLIKWLLTLLSPVIMIILSMKTTLVALSIIIFIDMITGIRKDLHIKKTPFNPAKKLFWSGLKSSGMRATWRKTYEYGIGILVFAIMDGLVLGQTSINLMGNTLSITELSVSMACLVEIYSIYENMEAVSGNNLFKKMNYLLPRQVKNALMGRGGRVWGNYKEENNEEK